MMEKVSIKFWCVSVGKKMFCMLNFINILVNIYIYNVRGT